MPIAVQIDRERRLVVATVTGDVHDDELLEYQRGVWSDESLAGYNEMFDLTHVGSVRDITSTGLSSVAQCAVSMDAACERTKFAVVAPQDISFGLARMYEALRTEMPGSRRAIAVFRSRDEAEAWLGGKAG